jgi:hypothetical protein
MKYAVLIGLGAVMSSKTSYTSGQEFIYINALISCAYCYIFKPMKVGQ